MLSRLVLVKEVAVVKSRSPMSSRALTREITQCVVSAPIAEPGFRSEKRERGFARHDIEWFASAQHEGGGTRAMRRLPHEAAFVQCLRPSIVVSQRAIDDHPRVAIWSRSNQLGLPINVRIRRN